MEEVEKTKGGGKQILICPECLTQYEPGLLVCPRDQSLLKNLRVDQEDALVGQTIDGRWLVESKLGSGGMGMVYLAQQLNIDRRVAVKTMQRGLESGHEFMERFLREANVASQVSHPHLVSIFDFGQTEEGLLYIVMEYLDGETLADRMRRDRLTLEQTIKIAIQLCAALTAAHGVGIVHRDLKPDNIFLLYMPGDEIFIKLLDFGIAKHMNSHAMTQTGQVFGTPDYMSPEQCRGKSDIDHRSDLYALGCILYELISGRTPFHSDSMLQVLFKHVSDEVPLLNLNVPVEDAALEDFVGIVFRLLEKQRKMRYLSAHELREDLEALLQRLRHRDLLQPAWSALRDADAEQADTARLGDGTQEELEMMLLGELQGMAYQDSEAEDERSTEALPFVDTQDELPPVKLITNATAYPSHSHEAHTDASQRLSVSKRIIALVLAIVAVTVAIWARGRLDKTSTLDPMDVAPVEALALKTVEPLPDEVNKSLPVSTTHKPDANTPLEEQDEREQLGALNGAIVESARLVIHAVAHRRATEALQRAEEEHSRARKSSASKVASSQKGGEGEDETESALLSVRTRTSMTSRIEKASRAAQRCPEARMQAAPDLYSDLVGESVKIQVFFDISPDGEISNITTEQVSGKAVQDDELFACIKRPYGKLKFNAQTGVLKRVERQGAEIAFSLTQSN